MKRKQKSASRRRGEILPIDSYSLMGDPARPVLLRTLPVWMRRGATLATTGVLGFRFLLCHRIVNQLQEELPHRIS